MRTASTILLLLLFFLCVASPVTGFSQGASITIKGTVTDETGDPLSGASINVKGTTVSTLTNAQGAFSITASDKKAVLVFSFVGLGTQEVQVGNKTVINVSLLSDSKEVGEVIVTALNIKRNPKSLGYSVVQLGGEKVNTVQTPSLVNALSGKVAGVDVGNIANGVAGTKRVVIRGATSLTGDNNPLWVIDGVPINSSSLGGLASNTPEGGYDYGDGLTGINPDDIETISVLKGNAAAALYGSRASNGVILVTTKSGKNAKGKTNVDFSTSLLIDQLYDVSNFQNVYGQSSINQANGRELPTSADNAKGSDSWGHIMDGTPAPQFDGVVRPFSPQKDIYKDFFRTGSTITNTISLYGSNANHDYRVSVSDLRNTDITPKADFTRTSLNTKTHSRFGKMDVDLSLNYTYEKANNRPYIGGNHDNSLYSLLYLPNTIGLKSLQPGSDSTGREVLYTQGVSNPYYLINKEVETDSRNRFRGSVMLKYDITNWLYVRGRLTRDYYLSKRLQYIPDGNASSSFPYNSPSNIGGIFNQRAVESSANEYEIMAGIAPDLKGKFNVNAFVGGNISTRASSQLIESGNTFIVPNVYTFNNLKTKLPSTSESRRRTNSVFGSLELSYSKYLFLTLTGRTDWFSTLPLDNNSLFYPAASLSFVLSDALSLPAAISFAKLRASTAQVSGDTDPYQLDLSYSLDAFLYNNNLPLQLIGTSNIPNKKLKPLLSTDYEVGLEMDFLQNRVGFEASYYDRQIKDDIVRTAVSSGTGYSTAVLNVGKLKNSGIEILLRGTPIKTKDFTWDMTGTFTKNNNKIVALGDGVMGVPIVLATSKSGNAFVRLTEGERYGGIYGFSYLRDSATGQKLYDTRGFPVTNSVAKYLGNSTYDKMFGLSNTFTYKDFSLYLFVDAKFGADIYSETNATAYKNGKHMATLVGREAGFIADGLSQTGGKNTVMVMPDNLSSYYNQIGNISEQFIYDASFVKLREVALRYRIANKKLEKFGITNASISLVARNLLTIYKDKDLENVDPESNIAANNQQGIERMGFPPTRNYGLTIKFTLK
ncbi:MAG TPA: SusC/RagA family TonB-linked outer membrane protein [Chitinophagaceae bacterium]